MIKRAKLTKTQQQVMNVVYARHLDAMVMSYEDWCWKSEWHGRMANCESYEDYVDYLREVSKRMAKILKVNANEYFEGRVSDNRTNYEDFRNGIVKIKASSNTIKALERKGYIEIVELKGDGFDKVKVVKS